MSVANGQPVNASVTNAAFVSKTTDSTVVSKVTLDKSGSGTTITDAQAVINKALDAVGTTEADATPNNYSSANFVTNGDNRKVAIGKLDTQLKTTNDNVNSAIASNTSQDTRLTNLESNNMTIAGNKTFSGNTVFSGDVTVNGTTTTINSTTQDVVDPNITLNKGGTNLTSEGAGITVDRAGTKGSIIYKNASATKFAIGNLASEVNIVDESTAQTLSNKNFPYSDYLEQGSDPSAPAATYRRIYSKADGFYQRDSAGVISKVGTGSGSGGAINLVTNGDADSAIATIFVPYQDSSGTRPIDGTGGTTTGITTALTATAPLSGTNSFTLTKDAANRQGGGWSAPFTVDLAYRAKSLKISVDYIVNSGTFVAGSSTTESDVIWYLYDVTNSVLIEPSNIKMFSSSATLSDNYQAEFQTSTTGSSYRLIAHIQSVSALAYELMVDNISVAPSQYVYAPTITDWIDYTPTITANSGSLTNYTLSNTQWSRVGASLYIKGKLVFTGSPGTWNRPRVSIPSGLVIDNGSGTVSSGVLFVDTGTNTYGSDATLRPGTSFVQFETYRGTAAAGVLSDPSQAAPFTWVSADEMHWMIGPIKIVGWTSNSQVSDGYDARAIGIEMNRASAAITANTKIGSWTKVKDYTNAFNTTTGDFTVQTPGDYTVNWVGVLPTSGSTSPAIRLNGTTVATGSTATAGLTRGIVSKTILDCKVNDVITVTGDASVTLDASSSLSIIKNQAPTTMSRGVTVGANYSTTATTSYTSGSLAVFAPNTKISDYGAGGTYNTATGEFTANTSMQLQVDYHIQFSSASWTANTRLSVVLHKNGSTSGQENSSPYAQSTQSFVMADKGTFTIDVVAGDVIKIMVDQNSTSSKSLSGFAATNRITFKRAGG